MMEILNQRGAIRQVWVVKMRLNSDKQVWENKVRVYESLQYDIDPKMESNIFCRPEGAFLFVALAIT